MLTLGKQKLPKNPSKNYHCMFCDYITCHLGDWNKHIMTAKHKLRAIEGTCPPKCSCGKVFTRIDNLNRHKKRCNIEKNMRAKLPKLPESLPKVSHGFECVCGRSYKHASSLSKHKKTCLLSQGQEYVAQTTNVKTNKTKDNTEVLELLGTLNQKLEQTCEDNMNLKEEIKQLKSGVMTAVSEPKIVNNNNYNNIIFLLNEKCGDAVAITDFANQIAMCLEDVDYAMENGKVKGIENIIRKKFEELGTFKRPLHCTDIKRGTLYVKNEEGWEKDKGEINKMIRDVECVQTSGITVWSNANPDYSHGNNRLMDKWLRIVQCLTGEIEGIGIRKIEKRCHEMCKIDQNQIQ